MKRALGALLGVAAAVSSFSTWAVDPPARDAELDAMLQKAAQNYINNFHRQRGFSAGFKIKVWADLPADLVYVDFGPGVMPEEADSLSEQMEQEVGTTVLRRARDAGMPEVTQVRMLYGGRPFNHYVPRPPEKQGPDNSYEPRQAGGLAVVSASHGIYLLHPGRTWTYQRPLVNNVREDLLTPGYGDALEGYLESRSSMTVRRARRSDPADHVDSHLPWRVMSSRYHLKALYPQETDIWNSFPGSAQNDRELRQDIRARPRYANFIGADALLSLHTNGHDDPATRGVEVYYHEDKPQDRPLADSVLCYMGELIHAQEGYEEFPFRGPARFGRHGENGIATMPSIIVEVAYHSSPEDALALQDPVFREASMKGVEKGYRLWREGKGCNPLKVDPIATIRVAAGQSRVVDLAFAGFPQYPVVIETKNVACPPGWKCTDGAVTLADADTKPAQITLRCENAGSAPIFWNTRMVDDDGVKSPPIRHIVQCVRGSGMDVSQAVYQDDEGAATARRLP
ncbi:N-acetylmuramoyl-L-alanine amidase [Stenotrophomonas sp. NPDC078853]|uniref:N-acetylmuramoyl-L-alanine amidase family protein n=1 Tax=Stenotrophomonas sp. NPDC078853 TaxID=3364534 RepID=UPI00384EDFFF